VRPDVEAHFTACSSHDGRPAARLRPEALLRLRAAERQALQQVQVAALLRQNMPDWYERGHKQACKQMAQSRSGGSTLDVLGLGPCGALYFQDRLDSLFAEKLKTEEEALGARCAVDDVVPANGLNAAPRASAVPTAMTADVTATAANADTPDWRGTCGICLERLLFVESKCFLACCCKPEEICAECSEKCLQHDNRCPLCRTPALKSHAEMLRRLQTQVDKGNAEAQAVLGNAYRSGDKGLEKNLKRAFQLFKFAAAQGDAEAQSALGEFYKHGHGVEIDFEAALMWFQRAAEQGYHAAQSHLGYIFSNGQGVVQSFAISQKPKSGTASRRSKATQRLLTTSACIMQEAKACRRTSTRRCASASAPRPRGMPTPRKWSTSSFAAARAA